MRAQRDGKVKTCFCGAWRDGERFYAFPQLPLVLELSHVGHRLIVAIDVDAGHHQPAPDVRDAQHARVNHLTARQLDDLAILGKLDLCLERVELDRLRGQLWLVRLVDGTRLEKVAVELEQGSEAAVHRSQLVVGEHPVRLLEQRHESVQCRGHHVLAQASLPARASVARTEHRAHKV